MLVQYCILSRLIGQLRGTNLEFPRCTVQRYIETSRWEVPQNAKHQKDQKDMNQMKPWKWSHRSYLFWSPCVNDFYHPQIKMLPSQKGTSLDATCRAGGGGGQTSPLSLQSSFWFILRGPATAKQTSKKECLDSSRVNHFLDSCKKNWGSWNPSRVPSLFVPYMFWITIPLGIWTQIIIPMRFTTGTFVFKSWELLSSDHHHHHHHHHHHRLHHRLHYDEQQQHHPQQHSHHRCHRFGTLCLHSVYSPATMWPSFMAVASNHVNASAMYTTTRNSISSSTSPPHHPKPPKHPKQPAIDKTTSIGFCSWGVPHPRGTSGLTRIESRAWCLKGSVLSLFVGISRYKSHILLANYKIIQNKNW